MDTIAKKVRQFRTNIRPRPAILPPTKSELLSTINQIVAGSAPTRICTIRVIARSVNQASIATTMR